MRPFLEPLAHFHKRAAHSISVSQIGDSASVQAATRVNAEQSSKMTIIFKVPVGIAFYFPSSVPAPSGGDGDGAGSVSCA